MFRDELTGEISKAGEKMVRRVVETRLKEYHDDHGNVIGRGREIVREINLTAASSVMLVVEEDK